jgi:hypothetical protein
MNRPSAAQPSTLQADIESLQRELHELAGKSKQVEPKRRKAGKECGGVKAK